MKGKLNLMGLALGMSFLAGGCALAGEREAQTVRLGGAQKTTVLTRTDEQPTTRPYALTGKQTRYENRELWMGPRRIGTVRVPVEE